MRQPSFRVGLAVAAPTEELLIDQFHVRRHPCLIPTEVASCPQRSTLELV